MRTILRNAGLAAAVAVAQACNEMPLSSYENLDKARRSGAVERGWVPSTLPDGAEQILEVHDLDTNEVWGCFQLTHGSAVVPFRAGEAPPANLPRRPPSKLSCWTGDLALGRVGTHLYRSRRVGGSSFYVVIDPSRKAGFFWSGSR